MPEWNRYSLPANDPTPLSAAAFLRVYSNHPPPLLDGYFVEFADQSGKVVASGSTQQAEYLPKIPKLFEYGLLKTEDELTIKGRQEATAAYATGNSLR
ncbi:MAG: hypothetical protein U0232_08825 [Thermomicrobiales bacterium]